MLSLEWLFWICFGIVAYTYFLYPIFLVALNVLVRRPRQIGHVKTSVSILVPIHNEEQNLPRRLDELARLIQASGFPGEIIVISDGSTDPSVEIARSFAERGVRMLEMPRSKARRRRLDARRRGGTARTPDFRGRPQRWADDGAISPGREFRRSQIGAVSGDLMLESARGRPGGRRALLALEKWLRKQESRLGSQVGVTGAISAGPAYALPRDSAGHPAGRCLLANARRPARLPGRTRRAGRAFDRLPDKPHDEFRRKVRTLAGNFQLLTLLPGRPCSRGESCLVAMVLAQMLRLSCRGL